MRGSDVVFMVCGRLFLRVAGSVFRHFVDGVIRVPVQKFCIIARAQRTQIEFMQVPFGDRVEYDSGG